ncbi:hypothetical protein [Nitratireductor sp. XY-223]|uniref:hypothetical protein n=1 Tax=Nitratireductor sp. XY-223 TaxID=2561926 RepID=UPI0010AABF7F|nr:hypothetical protein [Nitratireductor sp. XY-223]
MSIAAVIAITLTVVFFILIAIGGRARRKAENAADRSRGTGADSISEVEGPRDLMVGGSAKLYEGHVPEMCFVCAPFGGSVPSDLGEWPKNTRDLAAASLLGITDGLEFDQLQAKFSSTKTILVPDISAAGAGFDNTVQGSMAHLASLVMQHKLGLTPSEWECLPMACKKDAFGRCSPVGVLFVYERDCNSPFDNGQSGASAEPIGLS